MKVKDFARWLLTFEDQEAEVEVVKHFAGGGGYYCQGGTVVAVSFDPENHANYTDLRGNQFVTPDKPYFGARTLLLGEMDA
jgi:hypothetical protein